MSGDKFDWWVTQSLAVQRLRSQNASREERDLLSDHRVKMAVMRLDPINAALWSLAGFDPALQHFAELRERTAKVYKVYENSDHNLIVALDRALSVYLESQCATLRQAYGDDFTVRDLDMLVEKWIGGESVNRVTLWGLGVTDDPLIMELTSYAICLSVLTANGTGPWNRYASVMGDCYHAKHPMAKAHV